MIAIFNMVSNRNLGIKPTTKSLHLLCYFVMSAFLCDWVVLRVDLACLAFNLVYCLSQALIDVVMILIGFSKCLDAT